MNNCDSSRSTNTLKTKLSSILLRVADFRQGMVENRGDFEEKLGKLDVDIVEINFLENPGLVEKYAPNIGSCNFFSSRKRFSWMSKRYLRKSFSPSSLS